MALDLIIAQVDQAVYRRATSQGRHLRPDRLASTRWYVHRGI